MKKKFLLLSLCAGMGALILQSNSSGPAFTGNNRSGVNLSATNCGGSSCHGGNSASVTATIRVDSVGGVEVSKYVAGMTYTVTVTGANTLSLPAYGFQFAAVSGSVTTQVQAGAFTSLPAQVVKHTLSGIDFIEQSTAIGGPLTKSFSWTAPATGVGSISMYLTVNAVNGTFGADAADKSSHTGTTLSQYIPTSVANVSVAIGATAYPNPVTNTLNITTSNHFADYSVNVYDVTGRNILTTIIAPNTTGSSAINTANWMPGVYQVVVANGESREVVTVVKQ